MSRLGSTSSGKVTATDLDIRNLSASQDSISVPSPTSFNGGHVSVGTTAVEITFTGTTSAISIQSDQDNTGKIWVGESNVTNAGLNAFARLSAGQAITIDFNDSSEPIYAISDTASQTIYKVALV